MTEFIINMCNEAQDRAERFAKLVEFNKGIMAACNDILKEQEKRMESDK